MNVIEAVSRSGGSTKISLDPKIRVNKHTLKIALQDLIESKNEEGIELKKLNAQRVKSD